MTEAGGGRGPGKKMQRRLTMGKGNNATRKEVKKPKKNKDAKKK